MTIQHLGNKLLVVALLAVGVLGWSLRFRAPLVVDVGPMASLPQEIGIWQSLDEPLDDAVEAELRAELSLHRASPGRAGAPGWLSFFYYGADRGGRPEHTPRDCYPGAGWAIEATRVREVSPERGLRANEYLLERDGQQRLVLFWYRSHLRNSMLGGFDQNFDRIVGRLGHGRADGALIRVSTPVLPDGETQARGRLLAFASELDPLLDEHWPVERAGH